MDFRKKENKIDQEGTHIYAYYKTTLFKVDKNRKIVCTAISQFYDDLGKLGIDCK